MQFCFKQLYHRRTKTVENDKPTYLSLHFLYLGLNKSLCNNCFILNWAELLIIFWKVTESRKGTGTCRWKTIIPNQCKRQKREFREYLLIGSWADVDTPRMTSRFKFACQCDIISKKTISWHSHPNYTS